ncbi:hypothetical protein CTEN210_03041 [Chaetoceros tenuissimus]|uniref:Voltage-gated hydrogen channel 1 n=1 Tax=Chaetoceros tenuissimus TaxID=426638 RepID=A0AAD3CI83_9STRA|nr:hypothetical protein CTEN210_03041 [Chaetoceros tenuissimus]
MKTVVGKAVESKEVQTLIIFLIYIDIFLFNVTQLSHSRLEEKHGDELAPDESESTVLVQIIEFFQNCILSLFTVELAATVYAFGSRFCSHYGYMFDLVLISIMTYENACSKGYSLYSMTRLLCFLRFWRCIPLLEILTNEVCNGRDAVQQKLFDKEKEIKMIEFELSGKDNICEKERNLRVNVEKKLKGYVQDIEMLKEALHIAAEDVARFAEQKENGEEVFFDSTPPTLQPKETRIVVNEDLSFQVVSN